MIDFEPGFLSALAGSAAVSILVAGAGGFMTDTGLWYRSMKFPSWKPPDWAFGPIWTLVLVCATLGSAKGLQAAPDDQTYWLCVAVLGLNAGLNILWNAIFFALRRPDWAFIEVVIFWLSILAVMFVIGSHAPFAALYFSPYLFWVGIASLLNWKIVVLNRPFGALSHD